MSFPQGTIPASERLNVRDFGAKGDGQTDDTAAIQHALDSAVQMLGPTGLILSPVDCLFQDTPWSQVEVLIKAWQQTWTVKGNG